MTMRMPHQSLSTPDASQRREPTFIPPPSSSDALPAGARVEECEVGDVVATGGFSIVYRAKDHSRKYALALEEYLPATLATRGADGHVVLRSPIHAAAYERGLQAFLGESRVLSNCKHRGLLRVRRSWRANGTAYRDMPLIPVVGLRTVRAAMDEPPDEEALRGLLDGVLGALEVLHAKDHVHGAVSPDTIALRTEDDSPLLLGWNAAQRAVLGDEALALMQSLAPAYAPSADALVPAAPSPADDLHALVAVLRYCVDGHGPSGARPETFAAAVARLRLKFPQLRYSAPFLAALDALSVSPPHRRPKTVLEFRDALARSAAPKEDGVAPLPQPATGPAATPSSAPDAGVVPASILAADPASPSGPEIASKPAGRPDAGALPPMPAAAAEPGAGSDFTIPLPELHALTPEVRAALAAAEKKARERLPNAATDRASVPIDFGVKPPLDATMREPHFDASASMHDVPVFHPVESKYGWRLLAGLVVVLLFAAGVAWQFLVEREDRAVSGEMARAQSTDGLPWATHASAPSPAGERASGAKDETARAAAVEAALAAATAAINAADAARAGAAASSSAAADTALASAPAAVSRPEAPVQAADVPRAGPSTASNGSASSVALAPASASAAPASAPSSSAAATSTAAPAIVAGSTGPVAAAPVPPAALPAAAAPRTPPQRATANADAKGNRASKSRSAAAEREPMTACSRRTQFALYRCMQTQCEKSQWANHPQCVRLRARDQVD